MSVFGLADFDDHEQVVFVSDAQSGLRGVIAIHSTRLGPALGGCRMYPYACEDDALRDVLRLSRGMTYKAASAGVALGGGKAVIIGDPRKDKSEALLRAMGRAIERLGGRYITGEDIGTNPDDMRVLRTETRAVSCLEVEDGGYGDPAPFTALGVLQAIRAGLSFTRGSSELAGVRVAIQGAGNVGLRLCAMLAEAGAEVVACDPSAENAARAAALGARIVDAGAIYDQAADVFAPCAVGAVLNDDTVPRLRCSVVAGAANNQLAEPRHAEALRDRGIVYLPDYVANGGGLISCAAEWYRRDPAAIRDDVLAIEAACEAILARAKAEGISTSAAADRLAEQRLGQ
jgi:leucine dehydrogenase